MRECLVVTSEGTRLMACTTGIPRAAELAAEQLYPEQLPQAVWRGGRHGVFSVENGKTLEVLDHLTVTLRAPNARRSKAPTESVKRLGGAS